VQVSYKYTKMGSGEQPKEDSSSKKKAGHYVKLYQTHTQIQGHVRGSILIDSEGCACVHDEQVGHALQGQQEI